MGTATASWRRVGVVPCRQGLCPRSAAAPATPRRQPRPALPVGISCQALRAWALAGRGLCFLVVFRASVPGSPAGGSFQGFLPMGEFLLLLQVLFFSPRARFSGTLVLKAEQETEVEVRSGSRKPSLYCGLGLSDLRMREAAWHEQVTSAPSL